MFAQETEVSFGTNLSSSNIDVMQVNDAIINELRTKGEIVIDCSEDDRIQFFTSSQTFKISKINIPTTILITEPTGNIVGQSRGYLKVQKCNPSLKVICDGLKKYAVNELDYKLRSLEQLLQEKVCPQNQLCSKFKISPNQLREYMKMANHVEFPQGWLIISEKLFNSVFHNLLTYLTGKNMVQAKFTVDDVIDHLEMRVHPQVLEATLRKFGCQGQNLVYQITVSSITKFILNEMSTVKDEYVKEEFESIFKKMMAIYIPEGVEIPKQSPEIALYFLETKEHGGLYMRYSVLQLPTTANEMIQHLSKLKMRYSYSEAVNLFRYIYKGKNIDEALVKHFRKYAKDYELKGVFNI